MENFPCSQSRHAAVPEEGLYLPLLQYKQRLAPGREYVPGGPVLRREQKRQKKSSVIIMCVYTAANPPPADNSGHIMQIK